MRIRKITYKYHIETYYGPDINGKSYVVVDIRFIKKEDIKDLIRKLHYPTMDEHSYIQIELLKSEIIEVNEL